MREVLTINAEREMFDLNRKAGRFLFAKDDKVDPGELGEPVIVKARPHGFVWVFPDGKEVPAIIPLGGGRYQAGAPANERPQSQQRAAIPFFRASDHYVESLFTQAATPAASQQDFVQNITPGGFLRGIKFVTTSASGALGAATLAADYPWILYQFIVVEDMNGQPIFGPLEGFLWYATNKYGGHKFHGDPGNKTSFVGTINTEHSLWVPFEIRSDGLGSLANTDARAQYRVRFAIAPSTSIGGTTAVTTAPTLTMKAYSYTWAQVEDTALDGTPQEQRPPGLGTTMFWTREQPAFAATFQTIKHNRVGNLIRNIIYITRTDAAQGAATQATPRSDLMGDPIRQRLDNRYLKVDAAAARFDEMASDYGFGLTGMSTRNTGVYCYPYSGDPSGHPSPGDDSDYLETSEASYLALENTFSAAGTLTILTNDIAPMGVLPSES